MAAANLVGSQSNSRAAAAGRALLEGLQPGRKSSGGLSSSGSAGLLANMLQNASAQNLLAAAAGSQGSTMAKIARTASGKCTFKDSQNSFFLLFLTSTSIAVFRLSG